MQTGHGIVNGHWEPSEQHSRLLEVVRNALEKLTGKKPSETADQHEGQAARQKQSSERAAAAE